MKRSVIAWSALVLLALLGIVAAAGRMLYPQDLAIRIEPFRVDLFERLERTDPDPAQRHLDVQRFEGRYATHRTFIVMHALSGGLLLLLVPWQFVPAVRRRFLRLHRINGWISLVAAIVATISGTYFGLLMPAAGVAEAVVIALVALYFLFSLGRAVVAIRSGDVAQHREWMLRALGVALGISVIRIVAAAIDLIFSPHGYALDTLFAWSLWVGWLITLVAMESWIRATRGGVSVAETYALELRRGARLSS
jgi:uncharacterized membrane protein